jgi:choline dehydrogenase
MVDFDYVIVGTGAAGCVRASQLSEDPGNQVLLLDEDFPGPAVSSPDDVVRYALDTGAGIYHAVGASAMGPDASDVVDPQLRVRGVTGLRVVDTSVLPVHVVGNTQALAMAVAWIAANLILEDS